MSKKTMKAVVAHGANDVRVEEIESQVPGPGEVRIAIAWAGICGSDLAYAREGMSGTAVIQEPLVLGHEVSGVVESVGEGVDDSIVGRAVAIYPATVVGDDVLPDRLAGRDNLYPNVRYFGSAAMFPHTNGGMSSYKNARVDQLRFVPEGVDLRRAALAEPLAVALHAITRANEYLPGGINSQPVLVNGAGPIGLLLISALAHMGVEVTAADTTSHALERALQVGATSSVNIGLEDLPSDMEVIFEASGAAPAIGNVLGSVARGGLVVQVGNLPGTPTEVALGQLVTREVTWVGSYRFNDEMDRALELLEDGLKVEPVMSHEFSIDEANLAFETASSREQAPSKIMIHFSTNN